MRYFLSLGTRWIQQRAERTNHIFGSRYKWSVIEGAMPIAYAYKYLVRNPVRAGLCNRVEDYPYSTLNTLPKGLPLVEGLEPLWQFVPKTRKQRLDWLNQPTRRECEALIGRALRRAHFQFTTDSNQQKKLRELKESYGLAPHHGSGTF